MALAWQAHNGGVRLPRRLVYVVDRRTVVDQATEVAEELRRKLRAADANGAITLRNALTKLCIDAKDDAPPLAISTLRGERADNREWQADSARPAVIIGTVDMIGSRLLFSGYGVSRRMRPFHAGLLGQDTLLVHDEAHLSGPFGALLRQLARRQQEQGAPRPLRVLELSATQRGKVDGGTFVLTEPESAAPTVAKRLRAHKRLHFVEGVDGEAPALTTIVERALQYKEERKRVLVYVRQPSDAREIAQRLAKAVGSESRVALLTGTIRGHERDELARSAIFLGFRAEVDREPPSATEYLVATSAGEVGVDLDADHMVCDLSTLDSMIQRLGRVNRLGGREADVHVVEWPKRERKGTDESDVEKRIAATRAGLASLPRRDGAYDASPESLRNLAGRAEAFAPTPRRVPLTDILVDNWSLTRVEDLPGRPMPERWLHGVEAGEPDIYVAWREEVNDIVSCVERDEKRGIGIVNQLYDKQRILARERVRGALREVVAELKEIVKRQRKEREAAESIKAVLLPGYGDPIAGELAALLEQEARLPNGTVVLPPAAGGLDGRGMLDGSALPEALQRYDVADDPVEGVLQRARVWLAWNADEGRWSARWLGSKDHSALDAAVADAESLSEAISTIRGHAMPLVEKETLVIESEESEPIGALILLAAPRSAELAQDNPAAAPRQQSLNDHLAAAERMAKLFVERLGPLLPDPAEAVRVAEAVILAARHHDLGKNRDPWQADIGNPRPRKNEGYWEPLAKSDRRGFVSRLSGHYRHEFGSLREAAQAEAVKTHSQRDLILHLIAAHHGWARPHFRPDQWDIADEVTEEENAAIAAETMRRFACLQRRFGPWGLAWLESLMRAADYAATVRLSANDASSSSSTAPAAPRAGAVTKESTA